MPENQRQGIFIKDEELKVLDQIVEAFSYKDGKKIEAFFGQVAQLRKQEEDEVKKLQQEQELAYLQKQQEEEAKKQGIEKASQNQNNLKAVDANGAVVESDIALATSNQEVVAP